MTDASAAPLLVVEDSDDDFDTLRHAVGAAGARRIIHRAASGGDCLELLLGECGASGKPGEGQVALSLLPVLIWMDLKSHGVDGRDVMVPLVRSPLHYRLESATLPFARGGFE